MIKQRDKIEHENIDEDAPPEEEMLGLGADPSRFGRNQTAYVAVKWRGPYCIVMYVDLAGATDGPMFVNNILLKNELLKFGYINIDSTGLGGPSFDFITAKLGPKVKGFNFTRWKPELYRNLKWLLEKKVLFIDRKCPFQSELKNQLLSTRPKKTSSDAITFKTSGPKDIVDALSLAVYRPKVYNIDSIPIASTDKKLIRNFNSSEIPKILGSDYDVRIRKTFQKTEGFRRKNYPRRYDY